MSATGHPQMAESTSKPTRTGARAATPSRSTTDWRSRRPRLDAVGLSPGKRTRLKRLLYDHGPGGGTLLVLPIDQGLEHGPVDFFQNPEAL
ncbi:MAG TPA: hypothetical protein VJS68_01585, partial [Thermoplasmata archaeon]|nr:hypothetical protein [Thermoplasmata archaeon]